jgi:ATP adenylyltransferase
MDRLWSPWRLAYVTGSAAGSATPTPSEPGCIFCAAAAALDSDWASASSSQGPLTPADLLIARGATCFVILNLYPYNNGHLMVVPKRHIGSLSAASDDELSEMMRLTRDAELALTEVYQAHGINVGINLGRAAGAGVLDHVHIHLVPRWTGDTNFLSVVGDTRVLPEDLRQTAQRLRPIFERLLSKGHAPAAERHEDR